MGLGGQPPWRLATRGEEKQESNPRLTTTHLSFHARARSASLLTVRILLSQGNVGSPFRKKLAEVAKDNPSEMLVNELFIGDHGKIKSTCEALGLHRKGGFQQHLCYMTFQQQCTCPQDANSRAVAAHCEGL